MVALPNPSFEPETRRWRPGAGAPSREVPSQNCAVLGQKQSFLGPKTAPKPSFRTGKRRQTVPLGYTPPPPQGATVTKSPFLPSKLHDMSEGTN